MNTHRLVVPYNTGKVSIGIAYQKLQRYEMSSDALRLQRALLASVKSNKPEAAR